MFGNSATSETAQRNGRFGAPKREKKREENREIQIQPENSGLYPLEI